jgi:hypothetical protein
MLSMFDRHQWVREIHVIGLGGIGSWAAQTLIKLGVAEIHVYDFDYVEKHNTFFQLWSPLDIGKLKVDALVDYVQREGYSTKIIAHAMRVTEVSQLSLSGVVISGVDSMMSRRNIWELLLFNGNVELYMDGRIGGDAFQLYTLNPSDPSQVKLYEAWLYTDDQVTRAPCAQRDDFHSALALQGLILKNLISFARDKQPTEIYHGDLSVVAPNGRATSVVQIP